MTLVVTSLSKWANEYKSSHVTGDLWERLVCTKNQISDIFRFFSSFFSFFFEHWKNQFFEHWKNQFFQPAVFELGCRWNRRLILSQAMARWRIAEQRWWTVDPDGGLVGTSVSHALPYEQWYDEECPLNNTLTLNLQKYQIYRLNIRCKERPWVETGAFPWRPRDCRWACTFLAVRRQRPSSDRPRKFPFLLLFIMHFVFFLFAERNLIPGAGGFQLSNPPPLLVAPLLASLEVSLDLNRFPFFSRKFATVSFRKINADDC